MFFIYVVHSIYYTYNVVKLFHKKRTLPNHDLDNELCSDLRGLGRVPYVGGIRATTALNATIAPDLLDHSIDLLVKQ